MITQNIETNGIEKIMEMVTNDPNILVKDKREIKIILSKYLTDSTKPKKHLLDILRELPLQDVDLSRSDAPDREIDL